MINIEIARKAKEKLEAGPWAYLSGGADDEIALRRNRQAFQSWAFQPEALHDVSAIDTTAKLFGIDMPLPVIGAPIGGLTLFHERGDLEMAKGLGLAKMAGTISGVARVEIEKIMKEASAPQLFQLYFFGDDTWVKDQVQKAESLGCKAIVVTVDTKYFGQRERDLLLNFDARQHGWRSAPLPPDRERNPKLNLKELEKIKKYTKLPFVIKGITSAHDVKEAIKLGVDAVWISNHGGRQLDHVSSSLESLVDAATICEKKNVKVIFDGGIRRGSEVLIAWLLGADYVALGRLLVYGLAYKGAEGLQEAVANLQTELKNAMGLIGIGSLEIDKASRRKKLQKLQPNFFRTQWDELEHTS
jgi:isopentenyl diphosphate isomerase/L-lactate dehydrogenase-like FMN-dependent dehydrogenase